MSRKSNVAISFDVHANTAEALSEIKKLSQEVKTLSDKDGQVVVKATVNDKDLLQFDKLIAKYNAKGKNDLSIVFDSAATKKSLGETEAEVEATMNRIISMIEKLDNVSMGLGKESGLGIGSASSGDLSSLDNLKSKLDEVNNAIKEKQNLLNDTQSKIESQANAEIEARKRVQKAYEKWQSKEDKKSATDFVAEYDNYLNKYDDDSKLGFVSSTGRKQTADGMNQDYYDILDEYELTDEKLEKLKANILKKHGEVVSYSDDEINQFQATVSKLKAELQTLTKERDSLTKEFDKLNKQETTQKIKAPTSSTSEKIESGSSNISSSSDSSNISKSSDIINTLGKDRVIKVKIVPENISQFYTDIENGGVANIKIKSDDASISALKKDLETSLSNIKVDFNNKKDTDDNVDSTEHTGKLLDSGMFNFEGIQNSINELVFSIGNIDNAFSLSTNNIIRDTDNQISSINSVTTAVDMLNQSLEKSGVKSVDEFANFQKEFEKLQKEQENLNKQKEDFKKQQQESNKKQQSSANKLTGSEMISARDKIVDAANATKDFKIDMSSIKFDKNGVMSFNAVIEDTTDSITTATYKIEDFNKAVTASGKLSKKYLDKNTSGISTKEKNISPQEKVQQEFLKAAEKTKNLTIDSDSLKVDSSGIISFTSTIQEAGKEAVTTRYEIENLADVMTKAGSIKQSFLKNGGTDISGQNEISKLTDEYLKAIEARRKIEESGSISTDSGVSRRDVALKEELKLESQLQEMIKSKNLSLEETAAIENKISDAKQKELNLYNAQDKNQNKIDKEQLKYDKYAGGINPADYADLDVVFGGQVVNVRNKIIELQTAATTAMDALRAGAFDSKEGFEQTANSLDDILLKLKTLSSEGLKEINKKGEIAGIFDIDKKLIDIDQDEIKNQVRDKLQNLYKGARIQDISINKGNTSGFANIIDDGKIKKVSIALEEYQSELDQTSVKLRTLANNEKEYQSFGSKWVSGLKAKVNSLTQYITGLDVVMRAWMEIKEGFTFVKDLDTQMTTVYQTMDITKEGLSELASGAITAAKDLGSTSEQVTDAIGIYAAYGETVDSILSQTRPTTMLSNAAGTDAKTAADQIQAVLQQYDELKGQEMRIVNSYEKIAANVQIDFDKGIGTIAEGVQVAGSVAKDAGLEFEEFAGIVASVAETTRLEGSVIGNAMKTIMSRISRSKTADPDVTSEDRSDAAKAYEEVAGIKLYDDQGNYKDFSETLSELAGKWDTLTDAERNYIAEQSAGVRNVNVFTTMMNKYSEAMDLAQGAMEDTDFAEEVQDKWMESMQGKLNTLRASIQEFWHSVLDTGVINAGIEGLTAIVNVGESIFGIFGSIKESIGGVAGSITSLTVAATSAYAAFKAFQNIKSTGTLLGGLAKTGSDAKSGIGGIFGTITSLFSKDGRNSLFSGLKAAAKDGEGFVKNGGKLFEAFGASSSGVKGLAEGFGALAGKIGISTTALLGFTGALAGVGVGIGLFNHFTDSTEETAAKIKDLNAEYESSQETFRKNRETIDSIGTEWEVLSQGVDGFGNNISLTTEEFSRYHEICNQIASMYPNLVASYDAQGNAILNLKANLEELNAEYEKQVANASRERIEENLDTYKTDFNNKTGNRAWNTEIADKWSGLFSGESDMFGSAKVGGRLTAKDALDALKEIQEMNAQEVQDYLSKLNTDYEGNSQDILSYLKSDEVGLDFDMSTEEWQKKSQEITTIINDLNQEIESSASGLRTIMQDYLNTLTMADGQYADLDDNVVTQISSMLSKTSADQLKKLEDDGIEIEDYVTSLVDKISHNSAAQISLDNIFKMDENTSIQDMKKILEEDISELSKALEMDEAELKIQLGLTDEDELVKKYDQVIKNINDKYEKEAKDPLDALLKEAEKTGDVTDLADRMKTPTHKADEHDGKKYDYATTYYDEANNKSIVLTPVLPDGSVLSEEELNNYANDLLKGKEIEPDITLATFEGKNSAKQADKFAKSINKAAKNYDNLSDKADLVDDYIRESNIKTQEQLDLLSQCVNETDSWAEATRQFELKDINFDANAKAIEELEANLKTVEENIKNVNEAFDQSHQSMGMSAEQIDNVVNAFSGLKGYNYDKLFESTAAGVHLNVQELDRLNGEYERTEKAKYTSQLSDLERQYANLCIQIEEATTATERNELVSQRNKLEEQISQVQELASRYDGLTNSVTKFQQAMQGGEEGDTYDYIADSAEEIKRLYDEGLTGTNKFKSYVQMMTNEDMSGKSNQEYIAMYEKQKGLFDSLFTVDTATGAENFLKQLQGITNETGQAMASYDALNDSWKINNADAADIAKELGVSEGAITEIFKKLNDFGFDIDFTEETDHLKAMREEAEKANKTFNDFSQFEGFEDFKFDLTVTDPDALKKQIDDAEELRDVLVDTYGAGSDEVKQFDAQLDYLKATAGQTVDALDFSLNYKDNKDEIDGLVGELKTLEKYKDLEFNFDTTSVTNVDNQIEEVIPKLQELQGADGRINLEADGAAELMDLFIALINKKAELSRPAVVSLDSNDFSGEYQSVMNMIQQYQTAVENLNKYEALAKVDVKYEGDAADAKAEVDKIVSQINGTTGAEAKILTDLQLDPGSLTQSDIDSALAGINAQMMIKAGFQLTPEAQAALGGATKSETKTINADTSAADAKVTALTNEIKKEATKPVKLSVDSTAFDATIATKTAPATKTITVNEVAGTKVGGVHEVNGTAHANGTALANGNSGNWGLPKDETALVGELGTELRVNSKTGQWELIGEGGAEFKSLNKGDIIFNHKQTEELLKNGYVTSNGGRGRALLKGTVDKLNSFFKVSKNAYAGGYGGGGSFGGGGSGGNMWANNNKKPYTPAKTAAKEARDDFKETFDYIEIAIDRVERAIQKLDTVANSAYKAFSKRNSTLIEQFSKVTEEINLQKQAYDYYMQSANAIGLSEDYKNKIRNGAIQIEDITDENLADQIKQFQELYEKALDCQDAVVELEESLGDLVKAKFDNITDEFDYQIEEIEHVINGIENSLDLLETKGQFASKEYFEQMISAGQDNISKLKEQYSALQGAFKDAMDSGAIEEGSEAWYEMRQQINDVEEALQEANISLEEYKNEMREMDWSIFEKAQDYIDNITDESDFIRELLSLNDNDLFNKDTGELSDAGKTVGGLHALDYNVYMAQADEYRKKIDEINKELEQDPTNTILIDKKNEYLEAQREAILNAQDEKEAVHDLIADSYERMLDVLQELIDKRKEALEAEKDLYDYQKNVEEQTKNITDLQKQLSALEGDDSEEAKAKRQQLKDQLKEAESDLQDTEYDQWISDQEKLLDDFYNEYEEFLNERLDNIDGLMQDMIDSANENSSMIDETIKEATGEVGYEITEGMKGIWENSSSGIKDALSFYNENFTNTLTTTNDYIKSIYDLINANVKNPDKGSNGGGSSGGDEGSNSGNNSNNKPAPTPTPPPQPPKTVHVGGMINAGGATIFADSYGQGGGSQYFGYDPIYTVVGENNGYVLARWHGHSSGYTGWFRKSDVTPLETGGYTGNQEGIAMLHKKERVLNAQQTAAFDKLVYEFLPTVLGELDNFAKLKLNSNLVKDNSASNGNIENNIDLSITLPNVKDTDEFIRELKTNKKLQKVVQSITIDEALGKNSLNRFSIK